MVVSYLGGIMKTKDIIEKSLSFLINEYGLVLDYNTNGKENFYYFRNKYGSFNYYEWPQFGDHIFSVTINGVEKKKIDFFVEYPKIVEKFNQSHKGLKWLFKDTCEDYWNMIADIIKTEIVSHGALFGLKVEKGTTK